MRPDEHLTHEWIVSALDDELTPEEAASAERHLSECGVCRREYEKLRTLSVRLVATFAANDGGADAPARDSLACALEAQEHAPAAVPRPRRILRRASWAVAVAAGLALAALFLPWAGRRHESLPPQAYWQEANGTINVAGETFFTLPYSNPDLPLSGPRIVQMQVPVASLAQAGIPFVPISTETTDGEGSVLADVLVGMDGEPLGIHLLTE